MSQTFIGVLEVIYCANCGIPFGITPEYMKRRRDDHQGFSCPSGHSNIYRGESEAEKLRRERDNLKQQMARVEDEKREEKERANNAERKSVAFKGHITRIKNRVGNGICPCCNRTFANLQKHMQTQHKDYKKEKVE